MTRIVDKSKIVIDWSNYHPKTPKHIFLEHDIKKIVFINPWPCGMHFTLLIHQTEIPHKISGWPKNVLWPNGIELTPTLQAKAIDVVTFSWNGKDYYAAYGTGFK